MKFRYYIASLHSGDVTGTDDEKVARNCALDEDQFVVDSETGKWLVSDKPSEDSEVIQTAELPE